MTTYIIDIPAHGAARATLADEDGESVILVFGSNGARLVDRVAKYGPQALSESETFSPLAELTGDRPLTAVHPNIQPGKHALIFG